MEAYVYIRSEPGLWTVGFYEPSGKWIAESDHNDREEAAKRVAILNGSIPYTEFAKANITKSPNYEERYREAVALIKALIPWVIYRHKGKIAVDEAEQFLTNHKDGE